MLYRYLDETTDHFVVVVAMGIDETGKKYFQFVDNATNDRYKGAHYSNRLYYNPVTNKFSGITQALTGQNLAINNYIVTQVRKSLPL